MACFSCAKKQPQFTKHFTDEEKKNDALGKKGIIRVCESVLRGIYGADDRAELKERTKRYNKCGAWQDGDTVITPVDPTDWKKGYSMSSGDPVLMYPQD